MPGPLLLQFGTAEQRARYLPKISPANTSGVKASFSRERRVGLTPPAQQRRTRWRHG
ncbi:MAG: hypothetical protein IPK48_07690 [Gammaproteobacteria bacterium]|nr:hypothetical protein [Gammaproteobacteria bacterium]